MKRQLTLCFLLEAFLLGCGRNAPPMREVRSPFPDKNSPVVHIPPSIVIQDPNPKLSVQEIAEADFLNRQVVNEACKKYWGLDVTMPPGASLDTFKSHWTKDTATLYYHVRFATPDPSYAEWKPDHFHPKKPPVPKPIKAEDYVNKLDVIILKRGSNWSVQEWKPVEIHDAS